MKLGPGEPTRIYCFDSTGVAELEGALEPRAGANFRANHWRAVMRTLTNLMGSVVTGDLLADAVVVYHRALVARRRAALVEVPVLAEHDRIRRAKVAIGWLTGLVSNPQPSRRPEIEDTAIAIELRTLARKLRAETSGDAGARGVPGER